MHQYSSRLFCSGEPVKAMRLLVAVEKGGKRMGLKGKVRKYDVKGGRSKKEE